jgi:hypothetical protein
MNLKLTEQHLSVDAGQTLFAALSKNQLNEGHCSSST